MTTHPDFLQGPRQRHQWTVPGTVTMDGRVFIAHALAPVAVGLAAGLAGALALGRTMSGMLFFHGPCAPDQSGAAVC
ncbi:MAG: hypothetical protein OXG72_06880 [Acidobacteria bacterium]|nr:hypothetical protein [Acidobacteriota bacterium]